MAVDPWQELVAAAEGGDVSRGTMFGSQGLRTGRKFFAIWWREQLVVKLPADRLHELVPSGAGQVFEPMPGRPMNGWMLVHGQARWDALVAEARTHVEEQQKPVTAGGSSPPSG